jgi:hypothetical protein
VARLRTVAAEAHCYRYHLGRTDLSQPQDVRTLLLLRWLGILRQRAAGGCSRCCCKLLKFSASRLQPRHPFVTSPQALQMA